MRSTSAFNPASFSDSLAFCPDLSVLKIVFNGRLDRKSKNKLVAFIRKLIGTFAWLFLEKK